MKSRSRCARGNRSSWAPMVSGAISGSILSFIGHPLDTVKVRMQANSNVYASTQQCVRSIVKKEGFKIFYSGFTPALFGAVSTSAIRFGIQSKLNTQVGSIFCKGLSCCSFEQLPISYRIASEALGGAAVGVILPLLTTPLELLKCKKQTASKPRGLLSVSRSMIAQGGIKAMWTGHALTMTRSTLGNCLLFGSYPMWKFLLSSGSDCSRQQSYSYLSACGILSGWTSCLLTYPIDSAKARVQVRSNGKFCTSQGMRGMIVELACERALYRGLSTVLVRAIPIHALYLPTFDYLLQFFEGVER